MAFWIGFVLVLLGLGKGDCIWNCMRMGLEPDRLVPVIQGRKISGSDEETNRDLIDDGMMGRSRALLLHLCGWIDIK
jgi:hypothetical protein